MMEGRLESADWWVSGGELDEVAAYVKRRGFKRVALQFPDELLAASPDIAANLTAACNGPSTSREVPLNPHLTQNQNQNQTPAKASPGQTPTLPLNDAIPSTPTPSDQLPNPFPNPQPNHDSSSSQTSSTLLPNPPRNRISSPTPPPNPTSFSNPPPYPTSIPNPPPNSTSFSNPTPNPKTNPVSHLQKPPQQGPATAALGQSQTQSAAEGPVRVFVLADTTYGSCCVDEVAAAHADAQCVVHFGRACLSPTSRLPARFVFGTAPLDISDCAEQLLRLAESKKKPLLILFGLEYAHAIPQLRALLARSARAQFRFADQPPVEIESASTGPCTAGDGTQAAAEDVRSGPDGASGLSQNVAVENARLEQPSAAKGAETGRKESPVASASSDSLHNENQSSAEGGARKARAGFSNPAESSGAMGEEFRSGGLTWRLPRGETMADVVIVWVGDEGAALTDVMLTHNQCHVARYEPEEKRLLTDVADNSRFLRRRYYLVERAKNADIVGIVVGTLSSAGYRHVIKRLRDVISTAGKKSYTFVMGKPNPAKLANFPECGVFVLVACPQTALLDSKEYLSPVITPFEAELAFLKNSVWTGEYRLDFGGLAREDGLVAGLETGLRNGSGTGLASADREEEDEPRFSLISGAYEPGVARGISPDEAAGSTEVALVGHGVKALQVSKGTGALTLAGQRRQQSGAKSGAEYLVSKRTYQGLSVPQHLRTDDGVNMGVAEDCTPVVVAVKGRSGRAAGYADEK